MNMTLKARLSAVIGSLSALTLVIGLLGLYGMNQSNAGLKTVYEDRTVALEQVSRIDRLLLQNRLELANALKDPLPEKTKIATGRIEKNAAEISQTWKEYMATYLTPEEKLLADQFTADRASLIREGLFPAVEALREGELNLAVQLQEQFQQLIPPVVAGIEALRKLQVNVAKDEYTQSSERYQMLRDAMSVVTAIGLLIACLSGFFLIRSVYRQLGGEPDYAAQIVRSIAGGDLTVAVNTDKNDQQSLLFFMHTMQHNLAQTVVEIRQSTDTIATASCQIASGNLDLSSRTEQQAGSLEETASSMEELTSTVKQNADNASKANQLALSASAVALKGGTVVAAEVRNLAQRSAAAAKEIKTLIKDSVVQVEVGAKLVDQAGSTMQEILSSVKFVTDIMGEIAAASQEQNSGIEQINQAIMQMDEVTQQNAALVEEAAAAAISLETQASTLSQLVRTFKLESKSDLVEVPELAPAAASTIHRVIPLGRRSPAQQTALAACSVVRIIPHKKIANAQSDRDEE